MSPEEDINVPEEEQNISETEPLLSEEQQLLLFLHYSNNELPEEKRTAFDNRMQKDEAFAQSYAAYIYDKEVSSQKEEQPKKTPKVEKKKGTNWLLVAIVSLLALIAGLFLVEFLTKEVSQQAPKQLYAQFSNHNPISLERKVGKTSETALQAQDFFNKGDYETASLYLEDLVVDKPKKWEAHLALAICNLELKNYTDALESFKNLKEKRATAQAAEWYYYLTLLRMGDLHQKPHELEALTKFCKQHPQAPSLIAALKENYDLGEYNCR